MKYTAKMKINVLSSIVDTTASGWLLISGAHHVPNPQDDGSCADMTA